VRYDNTQGSAEAGYTGIEMFVGAPPRALSPSPLILSYTSEKSLCGTAGDQLLKGAAQNAVQIAEVLIAEA
jgi:hypothetical protein